MDLTRLRSVYKCKVFCLYLKVCTKVCHFAALRSIIFDSSNYFLGVTAEAMEPHHRAVFKLLDVVSVFSRTNRGERVEMLNGGDFNAGVNLGTGRTAKAVVAGDRHICVLLDNDTIKC